MTVTDQVLADLVIYGGGSLAFIVFVLWKSSGSWKGYLPLVDLASHTIGGLSIAVILWNGTQSFTDSYPKLLMASGMTNVLEPQRPIYQTLRDRRDVVCDQSSESADCRQLDRFVRSAYAEMNGEFFLVRVPPEIAVGAAAETAQLISQYNAAIDTVPRLVDAMA